jgi:hypothetical protein
MFKRFFAWLTGKRNSASPLLPKLRPTKEAGVYSINRDEVSAEASAQLPRLLAEQADIPMFEGTVEHFYDLAFVGASERCPRCNAPTRQQYANWVYATDSTPRAMAAPAGYFCTKCPTVIVDQTILAHGVTRGYKYVQVIGLTSDDNQEFQDFTTWNGQKPVYLFDENQNPTGLATMAELSPEERRTVKAQRAKARPKRMKVKRKR